MILFTIHSYLLILLSLCTLIRSDSALSYFQPIEAGVITDDLLLTGGDYNRQNHHFQISSRERFPRESLFDGTLESCAKQCRLSKFFCRFFVVASFYDEVRCIMDYYRSDEILADYASDPDWREEQPPAALIAAYECVSCIADQGLCSRIKEKIDNVKTISNDPTLLSAKRFDELLQGYGLSRSFETFMEKYLETILKACTIALQLPLSKSTDFKDWLSGEQARKHTKHTHTTTSNVNLLTFLDLFSRALDRDTQTIYNPDEGILFIHSAKFDLLVIVHSDGDYVWTAAERGESREDITFIFNIDGTLQNSWTSVANSLKKAAEIFGSEPITGDVLHSYDDPDLSKHLTPLLIFLLGVGADPWDSRFPSYPDVLFHDLSQVVPIIKRNQTPMQFTKAARTAFIDVQGNTYEK